MLARAVTVESADSIPRAAKARQGPRQGAVVRVHGQRLDHALQLGRVRHLQAQPQPRQVASVHDRHGYLRRDHPERRAHRPAGLSRGSLAQEHRHGQAPGVQALQRDGELARHHGPDDRPQPAAHAGCARPAGHLLLGQRRRPRQHGLPGALGQQVAAAAGELLVLPAGGRQAAVLPPQARPDRSRRRLHALQSPQPEHRHASTARCSPSAASGTAG